MNLKYRNPWICTDIKGKERKGNGGKKAFLYQRMANNTDRT